MASCFFSLSLALLYSLSSFGFYSEEFHLTLNSRAQTLCVINSYLKLNSLCVATIAFVTVVGFMFVVVVIVVVADGGGAAVAAAVPFLTLKLETVKSGSRLNVDNKSFLHCMCVCARVYVPWMYV